MRVKFLKNIGFTDSKGYHLYKIGREVSISDERAEFYEQCGYVSILGPDESEIVRITATGEESYIQRMPIRKINVKKSKLIT